MEIKKIIPIAVVVLSLLLTPILAFAETITWYSNGVQNTSTNFGTNVKMWGEGPVNTSSIIYNKAVNGMSLWLSKTGNPTGNVTIGVWSNTTVPTYANVLYTIGNISATTLTTTPTLYTLQNNDTTHILNIQQSIGAFHSSSTGTDFVTIRSGFSSPNGVTDGRNSAVIAYRATGGGWGAPEYSFDLTGTIFISSDGVGDSSIACIDTNLNGAVDLCFSDTNGDGIADNGQAGALGAFNSNANVTQLGNQWFCAFNIGDACNNEDVQTNGVGVFYTIIMIIFSYALLVGIHVMAVSRLKKDNVQVMDYLNINPLLLIAVLFLDVGFAWYLGFVEDNIFYTVMVAVLGLSALGIFKMIRSR